MTHARVLGISVATSIAASAVTALIVVQLATPTAAAFDMPPGAAAPGDGPGIESPAPRAGTEPDRGNDSPSSARNAAAIEELRQRIEQLATTRTRAAARPSAKALLAQLEGISRERQIAIAQVLSRLVELGPEAVPDIAAALRAGDDRSYGGGYSNNGSIFTRYPRMRTVLMDALRQIGTQQAKEALLSAVEGTAVVDMRDLMLLYQGSDDPTMAAGISQRVPDLLRELQRIGLDAARKSAISIVRTVASWIDQHDILGVTDSVAALAASNTKYRASEFYACLVKLAPEKAVQVFVSGKQAGKKFPFQVFSEMRWRVPMAQLATFLSGLLLQANLTNTERYYVFMEVPTSLPENASAADRAGAVQLLTLLRAQVASEKRAEIKRRLQSAIDGLSKSLEK